MDIASLICAFMLVSGFLLWLDDCKRDNAIDRLQSHRPALITSRIQTRIIRVPELDGARGAAQMELSTCGSDPDRIVSFACIDFMRNGVKDYNFGGDFCKNLRIATMKNTRANQDAQHASVFTPEAIAAVKVEALAFYASNASPNRGSALERFFSWLH